MSRDEECTNCGEKKLSRGEFLGVGAAAAASAAVGTRPLFESPSQLLTCPPAAHAWALPSSTLNILWADVWPRIVAQVWRTQGWFTPAQMAGIETYIIGEIPNLAAKSNSCEFQARAQRLLQYLQSSGSRRVPMRVMGEGPDFVLSDAGLDLFAPPKPQKPELLRFYRFRRTGRGSLGLPDYLDTWPRAILVDSPTGPSQVKINLFASGSIVVSSPEADCVLDEIECVQRFFDSRTESEREGLVELDQATYMCLLDDCRCWQLSGAVYRGIATELPRIVADIWYERETCGITPLPTTSYDHRFHNLPPTDDNGIRSVFEERMETFLPGPGKMQFRFHPTPTPPLLSGIWADEEIMITNRGVYLPRIPPSAGITAMLEDIEAGNAGNPVFTDSSRSI